MILLQNQQEKTTELVQSKLVKIDDLVTRSDAEVSIRGTDGVPIQVKDSIEILVEHPENFIMLKMTKKEKGICLSSNCSSKKNIIKKGNPLGFPFLIEKEGQLMRLFLF